MIMLLRMVRHTQKTAADALLRGNLVLTCVNICKIALNNRGNDDLLAFCIRY